eukprot:4937927-Pleurochrysis_carterae.AAC.1
MIGIGLETWRRRKRMKRKADRVAVMTTRMPCMMMMHSNSCAHAMAQPTCGQCAYQSRRSRRSMYLTCAHRRGH